MQGGERGGAELRRWLYPFYVKLATQPWWPQASLDQKAEKLLAEVAPWQNEMDALPNGQRLTSGDSLAILRRVIEEFEIGK